MVPACRLHDNSWGTCPPHGTYADLTGTYAEEEQELAREAWLLKPPEDARNRTCGIPGCYTCAILIILER